MFTVNVEGAVIKDDKWLICRRSNKEEHAGGKLSLVGGTVELEGFTRDILERTVKREIMEETGVEITEEVYYVHNTSFVTDDNVHVINIVFLCIWEKGVGKVKDLDELSEIYWMTTDEILKNDKAPDYLKDGINRAAKIKERVYI
ncbi:NUDIX hydrolase [Virgibacillus proomii]|uniref:NUDIX hydrolase n=1 Tax=Virgibacillus proomii TaxID=84407 RepID=UPI001C105B87|nr:NUDIX domain-containing protein [Virgibacillus proomii]MBU5266616.1 NUDIX domain-containing protein [Virgibacillus proomii]